MLLSLLYFAGTALAIPVKEKATQAHKISLKHHHNVTSVKNIVDRGHARLSQANSCSGCFSGNGPSSGSILNDDISYLAPINIGGYTWQLIVDTGSSNTWCGSRSKCEPTTSGYSSNSGNSFHVSYGIGSVQGTEYTDTVQFSGSTYFYQSIGSASSSQAFSYADGILGLGPVDLTQNTVANTYQVPTFMDNLAGSGVISTEVLGVYFKPESGSDTNDNNGELSIGAVDTSKMSGPLYYFPKLSSGPCAAYWGINIGEYAYNGVNLGNGIGCAIVDTGTTFSYLPTSVYNNFLSVTGGTTDSSGLSSFTNQPTAQFGIQFQNTMLYLNPSQYLVPQAQYAHYGLQPGKYYSYFVNGGSSGLNSIIGQKFLENYYSVYDTTNQRIGLAAAA